MPDRARRAVEDAVEGDLYTFESPQQRAVIRALRAVATQVDANRAAQDLRAEEAMQSITRLRNAVTAAVTSIGVAIVAAAIIAALGR